MRFLRFAIRPWWLILVPAVVSALAWFAPWPQWVRRGFDAKVDFDLVSLFYLVAWYSLLALVAAVAWAAGRAITPLELLDKADDARVYLAFTWLGAIGVLGMYALVELKSPGLIFESIRDHQFNRVRDQIPLAPGLATLRYATVISGAIALHRIIALRNFAWPNMVNVLLLLMNVLMASRVALLMSLLVLVGLFVIRGGRRLSNRSIVVVLVLAVLALTYANYVRNANYYEEIRGTRNPFAMAASESVAYLGSPFQVSMATGADWSVTRSPGQISDGVLYLLTPSFVGAAGGESYRSMNWYRGRVPVDSSLTTNSAIAAVYGLIGNWGFLVVAFVAGVAGALMGHFSRYRSYMFIATLVLGYCFAELWRIYLFNQGIVWFLVGSLLVVCAFASRRASSSRTPRAMPDAEMRTVSR